MRVNHPDKYWEYFVAKRRDGVPFKRDAVNRSSQFCYRKLGVKTADFSSGHDRGVYFASLYHNTFQFLQQIISEDRLKPMFDNSTEYFVDLWREKYAKRQIESLIKKKQTNFDVSIYDELTVLSWDQTKERYLSQVGR